ncbi:MAG: Scr1 family TA system antitoxin-like transcriptional regulator [Pseudonocardiaceae bacterium]
MVYLEHRGGGLYLEQPHEIETHTVAFEHLQVLALPPDESSIMIENAAEEFS